MSAFTPGAIVTIRGLGARPDLNGFTGVVKKWDAGQSRWIVNNVEGQPGSFALKEENLELAPAHPSRIRAMLLIDLPADVLQLIVFWLPHAVHIAKMAKVCKAGSAAAKAAFKLRPFSGAVRTLPGLNQPGDVICVDAAGDYIIAGLCNDTGMGLLHALGEIVVWQSGAHLRAVQCPHPILALKFLPDGVRFITGADRIVTLWNVDGTKEKTMMVDGTVSSLAVMPDGLHRHQRHQRLLRDARRHQWRRYGEGGHRGRRDARRPAPYRRREQRRQGVGRPRRPPG